jgi:hypothetical protein
MFEYFFQAGEYWIYAPDGSTRCRAANEGDAQQIVTALNAWQEIQQAYEIAQRSGDQLGKAGTVYLTVHALMPNSGVIPKKVHSAREEMKASGEEGVITDEYCPDCGEWRISCVCTW